MATAGFGSTPSCRALSRLELETARPPRVRRPSKKAARCACSTWPCESARGGSTSNTSTGSCQTADRTTGGRRYASAGRPGTRSIAPRDCGGARATVGCGGTPLGNAGARQLRPLGSCIRSVAFRGRAMRRARMIARRVDATVDSRCSSFRPSRFGRRVVADRDASLARRDGRAASGNQLFTFTSQPVTEPAGSVARYRICRGGDRRRRNFSTESSRPRNVGRVKRLSDRNPRARSDARCGPLGLVRGAPPRVPSRQHARFGDRKHREIRVRRRCVADTAPCTTATSLNHFHQRVTGCACGPDPFSALRRFAVEMREGGASTAFHRGRARNRPQRPRSSATTLSGPHTTRPRRHPPPRPIWASVALSRDRLRGQHPPGLRRDGQRQPPSRDVRQNPQLAGVGAGV